MAKNYNKEVVSLVRKHGCVFVRHGKGVHAIWFSPITKRNFTIDGNIKSRVLANAVMKQSGIKFHF